MLGHAWARSMCGAWALREGTTMRMIAVTRAQEVHDVAPTLTPLHELLRSELGRGVIDNFCGCVTAAHVRQAAEQRANADDAWEIVGPYRLALRREAWSSSNGTALVMYSIPAATDEWSWFNYYALNGGLTHVDSNDSGKSLVELQRLVDEATATGTPPPDDVMAEARSWVGRLGRERWR
jgi:hypothetical protein